MSGGGEMKEVRVVGDSESEDKAARLAILELSHMMSVPMSLIAVINLKVPDAIWQGGSNTPLSASQILHRVRPHGGADADNLQRILRLLASYHIFAEHLTPCGQRTYSLTHIGKTLVPDSTGLSYAPYFLQHHQEAFMRAWPLVGEAVEDAATEPFKKLNGEEVLNYYAKRPDATNLFHEALNGLSVPFMREMLEHCVGFEEGVETLVDVGGSSGVCLRMIMEKYPNVRKGINYDLPHMVACAPHIPGVIHVGGDAIKSVPPGDAIFMKWIFVNWSDEECKQVFKNCYEALPVNGKLIVCEPVLPELTDDSRRARAVLGAEIFIMTMYKSKGKHRTEKQIKELGISAGFRHFRALYTDSYFVAFEFQK